MFTFEQISKICKAIGITEKELSLKLGKDEHYLRDKKKRKKCLELSTTYAVKYILLTEYGMEYNDKHIDL